VKDKIIRSLKKLAIASGAAVVLFVLLTGGAILYTNRSNFCTSCHYMQPYYDAWVQSSHRNVPCAMCHYPPGATSIIKGKFRDLNQLVKYVTNTYRRSKPWAEIEDASCLRSGCHETRLLAGWVDFKKGVRFDHRPHLTEMRRGKKLRCTSCHSQIVQGEHISVTSSTCILCHFKERGETEHTTDCELCHAVPVGKEVKFDHTAVKERGVRCRTCHGDMIVGDGAVPKEQCYACHYDRERLDQYDNHELMHRKHITENKIECERCHYPMQHKQRSVEERTRPQCNACHPSYHNAQSELFTGTGGQGIEELPNPMFEHGLSCQSCHIFHESAKGFPENGETFKARAESCEICHGKGYGRILAEWKEASADQEQAVKASLAAVKTAVAKVTSTKRAELEPAVAMAEHNYQLVAHGKSVHNIQYAGKLLTKAYDTLGYVAKRAGGVKLPEMTRLAERVPSECTNCHFGIEEVEVDVFGIHFQHKKHVYLQSLPCKTCHSNMRKHGELVVERKDCLGCHHKEENKCGKCHELQYAMRTAQNPPIPLDGPDIMAEAGVECRGCHENEDGTITKVTALRCVKCHDQGYVDVLNDWQTEIRGKIETIELALKDIAYNPLPDDLKAHYDTLALTVRTLREDRSYGGHNYMAYSSLLDSELKRAELLVARARTLP
jgi:nitrate/TMAO reductase-like tetraheme cytochrome c subunit